MRQKSLGLFVTSLKNSRVILDLLPIKKLMVGQGTNATTHSKQLFLLDLFCGTAGVAAAFRAMGGEALGIDHIIDKRRVKGPVAKVDLSKQDGQATVLQWIEEDKVDAVMLAPPCGTASRAREIPVPKRHKLRKGHATSSAQI